MIYIIAFYNTNYCFKLNVYLKYSTTSLATYLNDLMPLNAA